MMSTININNNRSMEALNVGDNSTQNNNSMETTTENRTTLDIHQPPSSRNTFPEDDSNIHGKHDFPCQTTKVKWSDTESSTSSEGSSTPNSLSACLTRHESLTSSDNSSSGSSASSGYPSRSTTLTNISIILDNVPGHEASADNTVVVDVGTSFESPDGKLSGEHLEDGSDDREETHSQVSEEEDPWKKVPYFGESNRKKWSELTTGGKAKRVLVDLIGKPLIAVLFFLYFCIVALALMRDAFTLIGGSAANAALSDSSLLENLLVELMIGMLVTVLLQSSSATTSIIVSMVASNIIQVQDAIPMVMGANLSPSVTNTIVAGGQAGDRETFRLSFAGATVHDCFNWLAVLILLPLGYITGYLYHLTSAIVDSSNTADPIVKFIIQLDRKVLERVAVGELEPGEVSLVDRWCVYGAKYNGSMFYDYDDDYVNNATAVLQEDGCEFLFAYCDLSDPVIGTILLIFSLILLMCCLLGIVKVLSSMLKGSTASANRKFLNADFPGRLSWLTGYLSILVGCLFTMLLQSSSVFTSLFTPLVGMRIITQERMYPLTLGANLGTTFTCLLAAFASSSSVDFVEGVQIALCHLFFNLAGILLWYPIPFTRRPPLGGAKFLGNTTAGYRWFSLAFILVMLTIFIMPFADTVLFLAIAGWQYLALVIGIFGVILIFVITLNVLQKWCPKCLPKSMRTWEFLPKCMRSLVPYDSLITKCTAGCRTCKTRCSCGKRGEASFSGDGEEANEQTHDDMGIANTVVTIQDEDSTTILGVGENNHMTSDVIPNDTEWSRCEGSRWLRRNNT